MTDGKPQRDSGREGTKADYWSWRCLTLECSRYKEVQGRCELQGAPGERVGLRQVTADNYEGSDLQRDSSQHRGCVRLEGL